MGHSVCVFGGGHGLKPAAKDELDGDASWTCAGVHSDGLAVHPPLAASLPGL
jgi:hypothetical protein